MKKNIFIFLVLLINIITACEKTEPIIDDPNNNGKDTVTFSADFKLLLSRLNIENAEAISSDEKLLAYFRTRSNVKHTIDRRLKNISKDRIATANDLKIANDALNHFFIGQPSYPAQFVGADINWDINPTPDEEWLWQLHRMTFWSNMGIAYWHTGDEKYAEAWVSQLKDWVSKNPNDLQHLHAWRSIEAGIRGEQWIELYQRFVDSPAFTPEVMTVFLNCLYEHATYLMTKYRSGSNWALFEASGLATIAIFFPEFKDAENWRSEAINRFVKEIDIQVLPDGYQKELSMTYHVNAISDFLGVYEFAVLNGVTDAFPASYKQKIERMCEVPMKFLLLNGTSPQFGDDWEGLANKYSSQFLKWGSVFNRNDFLFIATGGQGGTKPDSTAFASPISGSYSMRSGWTPNDICLVIKCGPDGGYHSQPDNGTFVVYAGGRNLTPDAGVYAYSSDPTWRNWFRQTKVHQTLTLNGMNSKYSPKLLLWQPRDNLDMLVVENQSYDNLKHRRAVFFVDKKYFIVVDDAIGTQTGNVDINFQLAPGSSPVFSNADFSVRSNFSTGWNILIRSQAQQNMSIVQESQSWVSFRYNEKQERPAFCFRINKANQTENIQFATLVAPFNTTPPAIDFKLIKSSDPNKIQIEIDENGVKKLIECNIP